MSNRSWTPEEEQLLADMIAQGKDLTDISQRLSRSTDSIRGKKKRRSPSKAPPSKDVDHHGSPYDFENTALKHQIKDLEDKINTFKSPSGKSPSGVVSEWVDDWDGAAEWSLAEKRAKKDIEKADKRGRFSVDFPDGPIAIACISDQHIAPGTPCDFERMREDAELIRETPGFYAVLVGDGVDNHIKHRSAMISASSKPDEQWRLFDHYLQVFGDKILCLISGNHDAWTAEIGGVDYLSKIAAERKLCYAPAEARMTVNVGGQPYSLLIRHQVGRFNSSLNQTHVVKRFWEMNAEPFDIGVIGHHHEAAMEMFIKHGKKRFAARPGSYQITSPYAHQYGFPSSIPTCPTFLMFPGERRIVGFDDVRDAAWAWGRK